MGVVTRQGIKGGVVNLAGVTLGVVINLFIFPHIFTLDEIGVLNVLLAIMVIAAPLTQIGFNSLILKYFPAFETDRKVFGSLMFSSFLISALICVLLGGAFYVFRDQIALHYSSSSSLTGKYLFLIVPLIAGQAFMGLLDAYCATRLRVAVPMLIREVLIRLIWLAGAFAVLKGSMQFDYFILIYAFTYLIAFSVQLVYALRLGMPVYPGFLFFKNSAIRQQLGYAFSLMMQGFLACLYANMDIVFVAYFLGDKAAGIYALSTRITALIQIPQRAIGQIVSPMIARAWHFKRMKEIRSLFSGSWLNLFLIAVGLYLLIWLSIDDIILSNSDKFASIKWLVFFGGLAKLIDVSGGLNSELMCNTAFYHQHTWVLVITILFMSVGDAVVIPVWGLPGAIGVFLFSVLLFNILKLYILKQKLRLLPFISKGWLVLLSGLLAYGVTFAFGYLIAGLELPWWLNACCKSAVFSVLYCIGILGFNASAEFSKVWSNLKLKFS